MLVVVVLSACNHSHTRLATAQRVDIADGFDDMFQNAVDDVLDDSAEVDDNKMANAAFKIPRQKVDELQ